MLPCAERASSTLLCCCAFTALRAPSSSLLISPRCALAVSLPGAFQCIPLCSQGWSFAAVPPAHQSARRCLGARCPRALRCRRGWHRPERTPGTEGAAAGAAGQSPGQGKGSGPASAPAGSPAQAATSWASPGTGFLLETPAPERQQLVTANVLHRWSKEPATLRVPALGKLYKCRDDKVVQRLTRLVGQILHGNKSSNRQICRGHGGMLVRTSEIGTLCTQKLHPCWLCHS